MDPFTLIAGCLAGAVVVGVATRPRPRRGVRPGALPAAAVIARAALGEHGGGHRMRPVSHRR